MSTPEDYFEAYGTTQTYGRDRAKPTDEGNTKPYGGTSTNGCAKVRFPLVKFKELRPGTSARYLIKPIIPSFGLTLVWGKPKCGKSFWIFDAMMHVVLGWAYRGHKVRQGTVAYCALEGAEGFKARAAAYRKHHGLADDEDVPFYLMALSMDLIKDWRALVHSIQATLGNKAEVAVIVLDTVNRSLNGSESKDEDMGAYIRAADELVAAFNCAVILVHHCGHEGSRPRGHSAILGAVDMQIAVTRDSANNIVATVECAKDGPDGASVVSRLEQIEVGTDDDGELITSCIMVPAQATATVARRATNMTKAAKIALGALQEALADGGEPAPPSNHIPPKARVVSMRLWRQYAYRRGISTGEERAKQLAFQRATEHLVSVTLVAIWDDLVWIVREPC